jgi:hypothetical protein
MEGYDSCEEDELPLSHHHYHVSTPQGVSPPPRRSSQDDDRAPNPTIQLSVMSQTGHDGNFVEYPSAADSLGRDGLAYDPASKNPTLIPIEHTIN